MMGVKELVSAQPQSGGKTAGRKMEGHESAQDGMGRIPHARD
jgi:hypothetical protein